MNKGTNFYYEAISGLLVPPKLILSKSKPTWNWNQDPKSFKKYNMPTHPCLWQDQDPVTSLPDFRALPLPMLPAWRSQQTGTCLLSKHQPPSAVQKALGSLESMLAIEFLVLSWHWEQQPCLSYTAMVDGDETSGI